MQKLMAALAHVEEVLPPQRQQQRQQQQERAVSTAQTQLEEPPAPDASGADRGGLGDGGASPVPSSDGPSDGPAAQPDWQQQDAALRSDGRSRTLTEASSSVRRPSAISHSASASLSSLAAAPVTSHGDAARWKRAAEDANAHVKATDARVNALTAAVASQTRTATDAVATADAASRTAAAAEAEAASLRARATAAEAELAALQVRGG
jgi:hypothetical protein